MKQFFVLIVALLYALPASALETSPQIHGPDLLGVKTGSPFIFLVPATGDHTLWFAAAGLPQGLSLNQATGVISGTVLADTSTNATILVSDGVHRTQRTIKFVVSQNAIGLTPMMGWNTWYVWGCNVDEDKVKAAADQLISTGLAAHGYQYVNIDDCWQGTRDANGEIQPNARFLHMQDLVDYVHSKGLRIGIYSSPGPKTCQNYEGSLGHEAQDAATYSRWGMDLLKYDWCSYQGDAITPYRLMGDALKKEPGAILYSLCQYGMNQVSTWGASVGGNSWRTNGDLTDSWEAVVRNGFGQSGTEKYAGPGHFNDPDFLLVGLANWGQPGQPAHPTRLTLDEQYTHISLWSLMAAPLVVSSDLSQLDQTTATLLMNDEVIAIDQDSLGEQAAKVSDVGGVQTWVKHLADGSVAVGYFNMNAMTTAVAHIDFSTLGISSASYARDLWAHQEVGNINNITTREIPSHGVALYKFYNQ